MNKDKIIKDLKERNDKLENQRRQFELRLYHEQHLVEEKDKEISRLNHECDTYLKIATKRKNIIDELEKYLEKEQTRLARECSNIYEDSLGKTRIVNEDIFNEITRIKDKLKELKG